MYTLLVLAAGMGSRYGGLKQMAALGPAGETLLDYSVYDAIRAGFTHVKFVIRRDFADEFQVRVASRFPVETSFAFQELNDLPAGREVPIGRKKPWGTGHAVLAARHQLNGPYLVINADDFYGQTAYAEMMNHMKTSEACAMAGYRLDATLSDVGPVSRGLCQTSEAGLLSEIREYKKIESVDGRPVARPEGAAEVVFQGSEPVSLNFWGFGSSVTAAFEEAFEQFLVSAGDSETAEFGIPDGIAHLLRSGAGCVTVLPTTSRWFGVTYPEDAARVQQSLSALVENGEYPTSLWA